MVIIGSRSFVFPDSEYVFNNLLSIWNVWNPDNQIPKDVISEANKNVQISGAKGKVVTYAIGKNQTHRGWVGRVSYYFPDRSHHNIGSILLNLGQYSGIGRGRTSGFGRFRFYNIRKNRGDM